jgi:hypothetical protein
MTDRHIVLSGAAAHFDAFLTRAAEEFGNNSRSREETFRRIDAWIEQRNRPREPSEK